MAFDTGFVFAFTHKRANAGHNCPDCVKNPNTLYPIEKLNTLAKFTLEKKYPYS